MQQPSACRAKHTRSTFTSTSTQHHCLHCRPHKHHARSRAPFQPTQASHLDWPTRDTSLSSSPTSTAHLHLRPMCSLLARALGLCCCSSSLVCCHRRRGPRTALAPATIGVPALHATRSSLSAYIRDGSDALQHDRCAAKCKAVPDRFSLSEIPTGHGAWPRMGECPGLAVCLTGHLHFQNTRA